jgi:hypothetical protein
MPRLDSHWQHACHGHGHAQHSCHRQLQQQLLEFGSTSSLTLAPTSCTPRHTHMHHNNTSPTLPMPHSSDFLLCSAHVAVESVCEELKQFLP